MNKSIQMSQVPSSLLEGFHAAFELDDEAYVALVQFHIDSDVIFRRQLQWACAVWLVKSWRVWAWFIGITAFFVYQIMASESSDGLVMGWFVCCGVLIAVHFRAIYKRLAYLYFLLHWQDRPGEKQLEVKDGQVSSNGDEFRAALLDCELYVDDRFYYLIAPDWQMVIPENLVLEHVSGRREQ